MQLLTRTDVAGKFKVSTRTIDRMVKSRKIPVVIMPGGQPRFKQSDIEKMVDKRTIKTA